MLDNMSLVDEEYQHTWLSKLEEISTCGRLGYAKDT